MPGRVSRRYNRGKAMGQFRLDSFTIRLRKKRSMSSVILNPWPIPPAQEVEIGSVIAGGGRRALVIAGPCVAESRDLCLHVARAMKETCDRLGVSYIFKASFDKANRTSRDSYRGPG